MTSNKNASFLYLITASLFSFIIAYVFGNEGYEALVTIAVALGLLISWQLVNLGRLLFRAKVWPIVKFFGILPLGFFWFVSITAVVLSVSNNTFSPSADIPSLNWIVVLAGTLPFLIPRVNAYRLATARNTIAGSLVSLYSIMVLYVAAIGYFDSSAKYRGAILILAVQLQYLMSHAVTRTNYLDRLHAFAVNLTRRSNISNSQIGQYLIVLIVGLPFILPLAAILLVGALN